LNINKKILTKGLKYSDHTIFFTAIETAKNNIYMHMYTTVMNKK